MQGEKPAALTRAVAWIDAHLASILAPWPDWIRGTKRVAELCLLARAILDGRLGQIDPDLERVARGWLSRGWDAIGHGELFARAIEAAPAWSSLVLNYVPFYRVGLRHARLESLVANDNRARDTSWFVELAIACGQAQIAQVPRHDIDALVARSWLATSTGHARPDPAVAYETTHVIMWLRDLARVPAPLAARVQACGPRWLDAYRAVHNVDVAAELVMMLHDVDACAHEEAWQWLLRRQDADGSFPALDVPDRAFGRFHVTAVGALALAKCVASCRAA